jgi:Zn-finger nucleic acid-binding protein
MESDFIARGKLRQDLCPECKSMLQVTKGSIGFCVKCGTTWLENRKTGNFLIEPSNKKPYIINPSGERIEKDE